MLPLTDYRSERQSAAQIRIAENREIGVLNDRHADYISEVRFLQAVQRKLRMRLEQWMKAGKPRMTREEISESMITGEAKSRYDADAEKIPSLNEELNNTRSRYESAVRGRDMAAEDSLLVRLCDVRSQICLAKGRGKVIQEECARLRKENQKLMDDIASQRQIFDRETQERYSYERRAVPLLQECEELLKKYKTVPVPRYSFEDIERDRKQFRAEVEASMGDIRRQYEILASTVKSEMEQWYKEQVIGIDVKQRDEASSFKKRLADLRAELVDVRTRLNHLEERNRLLTSLIGDFEDARDQEQKLSDSCIKEDEENLRKLIERYNELVSGPREERYSVATLRAEILRYRELLDGVGPRSNRDISSILQSVFEKMDSSIGARRSSQGGSIGGGVYDPYASRTGQIGSGATETGYRYTSSTRTSQIGGGSTSQQIGEGVTSQPYTSRIQPTTVTSTVDYTLRDERGSIGRSGSEHRDYTMQRSAQGNVTIGKVAKDGSSVTIENTSMDIDQHIGEWTLRSTSSTLKQVSFTFPRGFILAPQSTVQIFARGKGPHDPPRSLVCEAESTFATGDDLAIYLYDNNGQERARLTQREFFSRVDTDTTF